jgi:hypothetical protein
MKHARRRIPALSLLALLICPLLAMATAPDERVFPQRTLAIEVDRSTLLNPTHVSYEWTKDGLEIKGRIEKRGDRYGRILGHAEIELLDAQGHLLSSHRGALQYFNPRSKDPDWASFETVIESVPSNAVKLRICHALGSERCPH